MLYWIERIAARHGAPPGWGEEMSIASDEQAGILPNLSAMVYRCRNDADRTMEFMSEGCAAVTGYLPDDLIQNRVVSYGHLIHPEDREPLRRNIQSALKDRRLFRHAYRIAAAGGEEKWVWEQGSGVFSEEGDLLAVKGLVANLTDQLLTYQALERRVAARTRELTTLLEVSRNVASTLEVEPLLGLILDQLKRVMDYSGATVFQLEGGELTARAYRGPAAQEEMLQFTVWLEEARAHHEVVSSGQPVIIPDIRGEHPLAEAFREAAGKQLDTIFGYVHSWMGVPLVAHERTIGMLTLYYSEPGYYSPRKAHLAMAFANEAALAIENARLYQEEQGRRREAEQRRQVAEGLRDILATINSSRPLEEILDYVVAQASLLLGAGAVALYGRWEPDEPFTLQAARGLPASPARTPPVPLSLKLGRRRALGRQPLVIQDVVTALPEPDDGSSHELLAAGICRALLSAPIIIQKEAYGDLELYYPEPREFSEEEVQLVVALADQAALAIENARLRLQAEQSAVAAERNRLARDLHDAVTQTLFSASLIAEVLPRLWERNPMEGRRRLEELRQLTRGALAEMRTLLLELRPAALTEVGLGDLLHQLGEAITGRARVPVALGIEGKRALPPDVQVALYRIAQEALNNVAKHASANHARVELRLCSERVELSISDDGCGFDAGNVSPEHLGLGIMRERAEAIGADLRVESRSGHGTRVVVEWTDKGVEG